MNESNSERNEGEDQPEDHDEIQVPLDEVDDGGSVALALPDWVDELLAFTACGHCGCGLAARHAVAAGIRRAPDNSPSGGSARFFAEVECPHCKQASICVFKRVPLSVTLFSKAMTAAVVVDGHDLFRRAIRDSNTIQDRAALNAIEDHEDFLRKIGLTSEQIDAWAKYRLPSKDDHSEGNPDSTKE